MKLRSARRTLLAMFIVTGLLPTALLSPAAGTHTLTQTVTGFSGGVDNATVVFPAGGGILQGPALEVPYGAGVASASLRVAQHPERSNQTVGDRVPTDFSAGLIQRGFFVGANGLATPFCSTVVQVDFASASGVLLDGLVLSGGNLQLAPGLLEGRATVALPALGGLTLT